MSLAQFLRILMARRFIIVSLMSVCVVAAVIVCLVLPARYPATARVLMDVIKPDPVTGQVISGAFVRGYTRTQTELIKDYRVAGDVVDRLGWAKNPVLVAEYNKKTDGTQDFRRFYAEQIIAQTDADLVQGSNILEISYYSGNPILAKNVVTALRDAYIDASLRFKTDAAGRSADWYVDQAAKAQAALSAAETKKSEFERTNGIVTSPGGGDSETMKLESMQGALMAARSSAGMTEISNERSSFTAPAVMGIRAQLNSVDDQIAQASERLGTSHPTYIALLQRKATLQSQLSKETSAAQSLGGTVNSSTQQNIAKLESDYNAQKTKVLSLKPQLDALSQLQREVDLRRAQYEKAAARTADLKLQADVSEAGLVPLGDAAVSGTPSWPNKPLILLAGLLGGLGLGIVMAILTEMMSRRVRGPEDLARASEVPVLAVIADTAPVNPVYRLRRLLRLPGSSGPDWQPAQ